MDPVKSRTFIKDLIFDLNTVRYLLDYGRLKETLPIIDKILDSIGSFRSVNPGNIFSESFWSKKLSNGTSFLEIRTHIGKYAYSKIVLDENLEKIGYREFIENLFIWSENSISSIRSEIKSPAQKKLEKNVFYGGLLIIAAALLIFSAWEFISRDWGLSGEFYNGMNFEEKVSSGASKTIDFDDYSEMNKSIRPEHFSARWNGYLLVPQNGQYTFYLLIDDGGRLLIDGLPVIDKWQNYPGVEFNNKIFLAKGRHSVEVDYYNDCCRAQVKLSWEPEGGKKVIIPAGYLRIR